MRVADGGSSTGAAKDLPVLEEKRKQLEEAIEEDIGGDDDVGEL